MKADISAFTFRPSRRFAAVVVGQGQALVDSTLNEQEQIARHRLDVTTADVVGASGVPKQTGGFAVTVAPDGKDLLISSGRIYVDGILCVNEPRGVGAVVVSGTALDVDVAAPDGRPFAAGQWIDVIGPGAPQRVQLASATSGRHLVLTSAPGLPAANSRVSVQRVTSLRAQPDRLPFDPFAPGDPSHLTAAAYRVELDSWHRHISTTEDASIGEVALGDAGSATRLKVVWQLRLVNAGVSGGGSCATAGSAAPGRLVASTVPGLPSDDPCVLPDEAGYRGLENQLYRVEVHSTTGGKVVLKWQRDNASTASRVVSLGQTLLLEDMGRDPERGFAGAAFVEVTDDELELEQLPSDLEQVTAADAPHRTVTLVAAPARAQTARNARARRWDGRIEIDFASPTAAQPVVLERGIQIALVNGALSPGDYWLIPARTANSAGGGTIEWPRDDAGNALAQGPAGIAHHRTALALVDTDGTQFLLGGGHVRECRVQFPPLTAIAASDVSVDPAPCKFVGVTTVQQAIDALCNRGAGGLCTATATPGPGWESVFAGIAAGADARVCFPVGAYPVTAPVTVANKGHLVICGAGLGSTLVGNGTATVLSFSGCKSVTLEALSVESASAGATGGIAGTVAFTACPDVTVRDCRIACPAFDTREVACLRVSGGNLLVQDTRFQVGNRQVGLLATDTAHTVVMRNRFTATPLPGGVPLSLALATPRERTEARRLLVGNLSPVAPGTQRAGITIGGKQWSFATAGTVKSAWTGTLKSDYNSMAEFQDAVDGVFRTIFAGTASGAAVPIAQFVLGRVLARRVSVMSQGIVVAGVTVGDIQIDSNSIETAIQGIHLGASRSGRPRSGPPDFVGPVTVNRNLVRVLVPPEGARARHAIFVGNADRLRITANDVSYETRADVDRIATDGIRVYGFIGRLIVLRDNVVDGFPGGIALHLFQLRGGGQASIARMWAAEDNMIVGASPEITLTGPLKGFVKLRGNRPGPPDN